MGGKHMYSSSRIHINHGSAENGGQTEEEWFVSNGTISHFHDSGRKSIVVLGHFCSVRRLCKSKWRCWSWRLLQQGAVIIIIIIIIITIIITIITTISCWSSPSFGWINYSCPQVTSSKKFSMEVFWTVGIYMDLPGWWKRSSVIHPGCRVVP